MAIEALSASLGREATVNDVLKASNEHDALTSQHTCLEALRRYLETLGLTVECNGLQIVTYRGQCFIVPKGELTPHEIEQRAAEIRAGWNPSEALKRAGQDKDSTQWVAPICAVHEPE